MCWGWGQQDATVETIAITVKCSEETSGRDMARLLVLRCEIMRNVVPFSSTSFLLPSFFPEGSSWPKLVT